MTDCCATEKPEALPSTAINRDLALATLATDITFQREGRIAVIRLDNIGDVVITLPLIRELKRGFPGATIKPVAVELFCHCPCIYRFLPFLSRFLPRFNFLEQLRHDRLWRAHRRRYRLTYRSPRASSLWVPCRNERGKRPISASSRFFTQHLFSPNIEAVGNNIEARNTRVALA